MIPSSENLSSIYTNTLYPALLTRQEQGYATTSPAMTALREPRISNIPTGFQGKQSITDGKRGSPSLWRIAGCLETQTEASSLFIFRACTAFKHNRWRLKKAMGKQEKPRMRTTNSLSSFVISLNIGSDVQQTVTYRHLSCCNQRVMACQPKMSMTL